MIAGTAPAANRGTDRGNIQARALAGERGDGRRGRALPDQRGTRRRRHLAHATVRRPGRRFEGQFEGRAATPRRGLVVYENRLGNSATEARSPTLQGRRHLTRYDLADDPDPTVQGRHAPRPFRMAAVFQGTLGKHRYTRLLGGMDLSKVIHAYGTMDEAIISVEELLRKLDLQ